MIDFINDFVVGFIIGISLGSALAVIVLLIKKIRGAEDDWTNNILFAFWNYSFRCFDYFMVK